MFSLTLGELSRAMVGLFVLLLVACRPTRNSECERGMALSIVSPSQQYPQGEVIPLELVATNCSAFPLWMSTRISVRPNNREVSRAEVMLNVLKEDGQEVAFACALATSWPKPFEYQLIRPGESVRQRIILNHCFDMKAAGLYKIGGIYEDRNPNAPAAPVGSQRVAGAVTSPVAELRVLSR